MEKYDFDSTVNRRGSGSVKWDEAANGDILPLWVADMDFKTAPPIIRALEKRVQHGVFGYTLVTDSYYDALIAWFKRKHRFDIQRQWVIYTSGVVPALSAAIKATTRPGDKVLVQTPVYNCFFSSIRNNGCVMAENHLVYEEGTYHIDFDDFEAKAADKDVKVFVLCNPHNPAGRVWTKGELTQLGEICIRHGVTVISDEIHCELVMPGYKYTPFASISDDFLHNSITCSSPSKAFNTAGLQIANIVVEDAGLRQRIDRAININEVCDVNPFGVVALQAAYNEGEEWLSQLLEYIHGNYIFMCDYMARHLPMLKPVKLEGTYLAWIDCSALGMDADTICRHLLDRCHLWLNSGTMYGETELPFIRINLACPRQTLSEALDRMRF